MEEDEARLMAHKLGQRLTRRSTLGPKTGPSEGDGSSGRESMLGFASGLFAGMVGVITGFPFDTLKIHQQIYGTTKGALAGLGGQGGASFSIRRLFRGIGAPLVTTGFVQTLNFGIYDNVLRSLAVNHEARLQDYFVAGSVSGSCISIITCPVSLIKIQLQTTSGVGVVTVLQRMMARGLVSGFYPAFIPDLINQGFGRGVYMMTYEAIKRLQRSEEEESALTLRPQPLTQRIIAGGVAGIAGWLSIFPLDVIKSRMQADALNDQRRYRGMWDCAVQSYRAGGVASLYQGLGFTLVRAVPVASVILPTYDAVYYILANMLAEERQQQQQRERSPP